jgi:hypothetical protein
MRYFYEKLWMTGLPRPFTFLKTRGYSLGAPAATTMHRFLHLIYLNLVTGSGTIRVLMGAYTVTAPNE